jgi:hypothetical protein
MKRVLAGLALTFALGACSTTSPPPASPAPAPSCTAGYSPCLPQASDYDCYGGEGEGPYFTAPGITYAVTGSDPYELDRDGDGRGCDEPA